MSSDALSHDDRLSDAEAFRQPILHCPHIGCKKSFKNTQDSSGHYIACKLAPGKYCHFCENFVGNGEESSGDAASSTPKAKKDYKNKKLSPAEQLQISHRQQCALQYIQRNKQAGGGSSGSSGLAAELDCCVKVTNALAGNQSATLTFFFCPTCIDNGSDVKTAYQVLKSAPYLAQHMQVHFLDGRNSERSVNTESKAWTW